MCEEINDKVETKIVTANFNEKNVIFRKKKSIYFLPFFKNICISSILKK